MNNIVNIKQANRYTRMFLAAVSVSLAGQYTYWIVQGYLNPELAFSDWQRTVIGALFVLNILLHWLCQYIAKRWAWAYVLFQAVVFLAIGLNAGNLVSITGPMTIPLLGEMIAVYDNLIWMALTQIVFIVVQLFAFRVIYGPAAISFTLSSEVSAIIFSVPYYAALILQNGLRRQAQHLLYELDMAHRQLAVYADQVEQLTLVTERARLARELHDTLAQGTAGIILQLEALDAYLEQGNIDRVGQIVTQIKSRARISLADSRRAIDDLRIAPDRQGALLIALREEAERFSTVTGVPCTLDLPTTLTIPTSIMEHVLRCTTESLANIARHAHARQVVIVLHMTGAQLLLEIRDDGVGFDTLNAPPVGHYGLIGLRERARLVGGMLDVESSPGRGTTIRLHCHVNIMLGQANA